jgi:predicted CopG family antitoxin
MSSTKLRQIIVDETNYRALKDLGKAGDSFNDVIKRLLENKPKEEIV